MTDDADAVDLAVYRGQLTNSLGLALRSSKHGLDVIPGLLRLVLDKEAWRERVVIETGERVPGFPAFAAYVAAHPPDGLGASVDLIRRIVGHDDPATLDLLDRALQNPPHIHADNNNVQVSAPQGNAADRALRTLRAHHPDLHARVLAGELSPHAAMVQAGRRHKTLTIPIDDMCALARALHRHLTADEREELQVLLEMDAGQLRDYAEQEEAEETTIPCPYCAAEYGLKSLLYRYKDGQRYRCVTCGNWHHITS